MDFPTLLAFIDRENQRLIAYYRTESLPEKTRAFGRMVKLMEELGELSEALLGYYGNQRKEKLSRFDRAYLEGEFADVIITTLLLARTLDVDIREVLEKKIERIEERHRSESEE